MFAKPRDAGAGHVAKNIKMWVRDLLALDEADTVMVSELRCHEPDCPPVETVIAVMQPGCTERRVWKMHRPSAELTRDDLATLVQNAHRHSHPIPEIS